MKERLGAADYRFIAICVALLAGTTWYSTHNFHRAFPEASIDFRVNRDDARDLARKFLGAQGYGLGEYREASSFSFDDDAKTFLEREAGLEQANQLMGTRLRLWRWSYRWFRPQQKEEYRADITASGEFAGFSHDLPEDAARPSATQDEARAVAEEFLRTRAHRDPASMDFIESANTVRPKRTDRVFTWKERDFNLHDATYRVEVTVLGNEAGGYREYLKIPEQWTRDYERLRSKNNMAQTFDGVASIALFVGLIAVIVAGVRRQDIRWRRAVMFGMAGMALSFLSSLNEFPLNEFSYPTTDAYSSFLIRQVLQAALSALGLGGFLFVIVAGAEMLYRAAFPTKISVGNLLRPRGLRTKRFFLGAILGITLTGIFIAYQTVFYITATHFGAWSPADVPYSDLLNTKAPWLFVLLGGFFPAVFEEFGFRMFAIPFLRKVTRSLPLAVVLAGFVWGFGHSGYPQQPFFIRGLEVGIGGVALGCIMLRWGILPTLVWHYSVDAMYSAMLLLRSHSLYFKLSGAASAGLVVLPVAIALIAYWRRGGFEPDTGLLNGDEEASTEPPQEEPVESAPQEKAGYARLTRGWRIGAVAIFAAGLATLAIPAAHFGESPRFLLPAASAQQAAEAFLRSLQADPDSYRKVVYPAIHAGADDGLAAKYFIQRRPLSVVSKLFADNRPVRHWAVRFFRPLDQEEFLVTVHPETGMVMGWHHELPEDRAGADIGVDAARQIATQYALVGALDVTRMELKESVSNKRKARRDHTFTWEARPGDTRNVDEARLRVTVEVAGDRVISLRSYWKVPEAFERTRSQQNAASIAVVALDIAATAGTAVFGLFMLVMMIRNGAVPWSLVCKLAAVPAAATLVSIALSLPVAMYRNYPTSVQFETWQAERYASIATSVLMALVLYGAAAAIVVSFFPRVLTACRGAGRRAMASDALLVLLAAAGLAIFCQQAGAVLTDRFHAAAIPDVDGPGLVGMPAPALGAIASAIRWAALRAAALAVLALAASKLRKGWMVAPMVMLLVCAGLPEEIREPGELLLAYAITLLEGLAVWALCRWFARENYLAYALALVALGLRPALGELFGSGNAGLVAQGWLVVAIFAATVVWMCRGASKSTA